MAPIHQLMALVHRSSAAMWAFEIAAALWKGRFVSKLAERVESRSLCNRHSAVRELFLARKAVQYPLRHECTLSAIPSELRHTRYSVEYTEDKLELQMGIVALFAGCPRERTL